MPSWSCRLNGWAIRRSHRLLICKHRVITHVRRDAELVLPAERLGHPPQPPLADLKTHRGTTHVINSQHRSTGNITATQDSNNNDNRLVLTTSLVRS